MENFYGFEVKEFEFEGKKQLLPLLMKKTEKINGCLKQNTLVRFQALK